MTEQKPLSVVDILRGATLVAAQPFSLDELLEEMHKHLYLLVPYDSVCIFLVMPDSSLQIVAKRGYKAEIKDDNYKPEQNPSENNLLRQIIATSHSKLIRDVSTCEDWCSPLSVEVVRSWLGIPLVARGHTIGIYSLEKYKPSFFTETHQYLAEAIATCTAVALENIQLHEKMLAQSRQLKASQTLLTEADKMVTLGRMTSTIGHEINNPVQAIQGCLTLAQEELNGDRNSDLIDNCLQIIDSELSRLSGIMYRMREFYRPAQQALQPTQLKKTVSGVLDLLRHQLERNNINIIYHHSDTLPYILGNEAYLRQIFLNLILNAIDAMPQGGQLQITLSPEHIYLTDKRSMQPAIKIELQDNGEGIPSHIRRHLFKPFITSKENGSGLGLAVTYSLIEAHRGQITVESQLGVGTTFTILFPAYEMGMM